MYEYYLARHAGLRKHEAFLAEVDRFDSGQLTREDVESPSGVILLGYTLDPRTGLGAFKDYFSQPARGVAHEDGGGGAAPPRARGPGGAHARAGQADSARTRWPTRPSTATWCLTDFRSLDEMPVGNRFLVYTLFPEMNISVRLAWGPKRERVVVNVGWSIFNRTCKTNVGVLMSLYGGGGHKGAGSCMLPVETADAQVRQMIDTLRGNG